MVGFFTLGPYSDDARWAAAVVSAVVVGVTYHLAAEHPFPTAVEDGVCALLYLSGHAENLGIILSQISLSGFSAGSNPAFTVPIRLQMYMSAISCRQGNISQLLHIVAIIAWYPNVDNRLARAQRRASNPGPSKNPIFNPHEPFRRFLFPYCGERGVSDASPAATTDEDLTMALPDDIALCLCEWEMLLQEGKDCADRLERMGKRARTGAVTEREHAFYKSPWPFTLDWKVGTLFKQATDWLVRFTEFRRIE
ncbi:MAG: hypothetical protein Q9178_006706 [Gyalolechia marmorata]